MADKNVKIGIGVEGADEAAADVAKVDKALSDVDSSAAAASKSTAALGDSRDAAAEFRDGLNSADQETRELTKSTRDLNSALRDQAKAADQATDEITALGSAEDRAARSKRKLRDDADAAGSSMETAGRKSNVAGAALAGFVIGADIAAKNLAKLREGIDSIDVEKLRGLAPEAAAQVESLKGFSELFSSPLDALQRLISGETVGDVFQSLNEQIEAAARQNEMAVDRMIESGTRQRDEIAKLAAEIASANRILDARDQADAAARDREDAAAIAAGKAPEDVRADRARYDAEQERGRITRSTIGPQQAYDVARQEADQRRENANRVAANPDATPEKIREAKQKQAEAEAERDRLRQELEEALAIAEQRRRAVRERESGTIEDAGREKEARLAREKEQQEERRRREEERARKAADDAALRGRETTAERQRGAINSRATDLADDVSKAATKGRAAGGDEKVIKALEQAAKALADGTNPAEMARVAQQIQQAAEQSGSAALRALEAQAQAIKELTDRLEAFERVTKKKLRK
ncbi:MAG: hypothetical protein MUF31_16705 [Akkermansiaceae bacterium]|jgi:hypothetical protein|nr:hypothetical protein [Akkermansiaceae bacterium]